jgi:hypothetical protein
MAERKIEVEAMYGAHTKGQPGKMDGFATVEVV